jgi:hypothetical protein
MITAPEIKTMLLELSVPERDFTIKFAGRSDCVEGRYYHGNPGRITLYNTEQKTDNKLIRLAIHEYAHHLLPRLTHHKKIFFTLYFNLLNIAIEKNIYRFCYSDSEKLLYLTERIMGNKLIKDGKVLKKGSWFLGQVFKTCIDEDIDFQIYTTKILHLSWIDAEYPLRKYNALIRRCVSIQNPKYIQYLRQIYFLSL